MKVKCINRDECVEEVTFTCSPNEALIIIKALRYAYGERWCHEETLIVKQMLEVFDNFEWAEESDDLKPCPFCGGEAIIRKMNEGWKHGHIIDSFIIECIKCGTNLPPFESDIWIGSSGYVHIDKNGYEDAIKAWNKRANDEHTD